MLEAVSVSGGTPGSVKTERGRRMVLDRDRPEARDRGRPYIQKGEQ